MKQLAQKPTGRQQRGRVRPISLSLPSSRLAQLQSLTGSGAHATDKRTQSSFQVMRQAMPERPRGIPTALPQAAPADRSPMTGGLEMPAHQPQVTPRCWLYPPGWVSHLRSPLLAQGRWGLEGLNLTYQDNQQPCWNSRVRPVFTDPNGVCPQSSHFISRGREGQGRGLNNTIW